MRRFAWSLVLIMLLHSLFSCAVAADHADNSHHSYHYNVDSHSHGQPATEDAEPDHDHQFHAHVSCITSYDSVQTRGLTPEQAIDSRILCFESQQQQPPVPPPND